MANKPKELKPHIYVPNRDGESKRKLMQGSGTTTTWDFDWDVPGSYDGEGVITVDGVDLAGNAYVYDDEDKLVFTIDNTFPETEIKITNYASDSYDFTVEWLSSESYCTFDVQHRTPGENWIDWEIDASLTSKDFHASGDGTYKFRVKATDLAGNVEKEWSKVVIEIEVGEE